MSMAKPMIIQTNISASDYMVNDTLRLISILSIIHKNIGKNGALSWLLFSEWI